MIIYDDLIPFELQENIENRIMDIFFPWYLYRDTMGNQSGWFINDFYDDKTSEGLQFVHMMYCDKMGILSEDFLTCVMPVIDNLGIKYVEKLRMKVNLNVCMPNYNKEHHFPIHTDYKNVDYNFLTGIYYVIDSDGDTILYDKKGKNEMMRVTPKKGRVVLFDGKTPHAGQPPIKSDYRCLINFNLRIN